MVPWVPGLSEAGPAPRELWGCTSPRVATACWTDELVDGIAVFDLDVVYVEAREKVKDLGTRVEGILAQERIRANTDPEHDRTADLLVSVSVSDEANDPRPWVKPTGVESYRKLKQGSAAIG
jgi:hypothetical protein